MSVPIVINTPLSAYCPYSVTIVFRPVSVLVLAITCVSFWSFSLGVVVNHGPVVLTGGV